jgi:hypothetical protein
MLTFYDGQCWQLYKQYVYGDIISLFYYDDIQTPISYAHPKKPYHTHYIMIYAHIAV